MKEKRYKISFAITFWSLFIVLIFSGLALEFNKKGLLNFALASYPTCNETYTQTETTDATPWEECGCSFAVGCYTMVAHYFCRTATVCTRTCTETGIITLPGLGESCNTECSDWTCHTENQVSEDYYCGCASGCYSDADCPPDDGCNDYYCDTSSGTPGACRAINLCPVGPGETPTPSPSGDVCSEGEYLSMVTIPPTNFSVTPGGKAEIVLSFSVSSGSGPYTSVVSANCPPSSTCTFTQNDNAAYSSGPSPFTVVTNDENNYQAYVRYTITTTPSTPAGIYTINFSASGSGCEASSSAQLEVGGSVSMVCDGQWRDIPTSLSIRPGTNPVTVYIPPNTGSAYPDSIGVGIVGDNPNVIYHQNCAFNGGSSCGWFNDWQMIPGNISGGGSIYSYTLTNINTLLYGVNQLWKLLVQYSLGNFATVNWSGSGWNPWYGESGSPPYGTPTSATAHGYTFNFRRNPSYPYNAQYQCYQPCPSGPTSYPSDSWDRVWCDKTLTAKLADLPDEGTEQFNNNWGTGTVADIRPDDIGFHSGRTINFPLSGTYTFNVGSDDGVRVWIDDNLVLDRWLDRGYTVDTFTYSLTAGNHRVRIDYYENGGSAAVSFGYTLPNSPPTVPSVTIIEPDYCSSGPAAYVNWTYSDPENNPQSAYQVQIDDTGSAWNPPYIFDCLCQNGTFSGSACPLSGACDGSLNSIFASGLAFNVTYKARVRVWDSNNNVSNWTESSSWKTPKHAYPQVNFTYSPSTNIPANQPVQFTDQTIFTDTGGTGQRSWSWLFKAPASIPSSTLQNPTYTYTDPGSYQVQETVTDKDGYTCSITKQVNIALPIPIWKEVAP